ncbi:uncharacterized protein SPPG_06388 [Spizellomyces punctatus DAOM BR117]|uniref:IQCH-like ATP-grasp domain-containing protein n=1 Tax=Spizellomyces punctatus (strain DAOM BR117) TaxID=645134 RepID=A0A0L0HAV7_SPIPD|nr:uncharacterized protein SPPG_06388 [Spizellomyces punctatus DAOM BR117]KNC98710.1 hypothetical protein SPPG_06388 [Spizellomyces punctatus DAOM BR117]|eukprot:XP_016606750.1 hypothetical protein SPPG_06388 [Spizellomyces punctatus DAOM BR117]
MSAGIGNDEPTLKNYWEEVDQDLVVLPSLTFDAEELNKISGLVNYEERLLYHILHLTHPATRVIYISSMPLDPEVINYYISLLPSSLSHKDLSRRLRLFSVHDPSGHCLAQKLLRRPRLLQRIKGIIRPSRARLQVYRRTMFEKRVAEELGLKLEAATPEEMKWGTKSGSRKAFREAQVPHPVGTYQAAQSVEALVEAIGEVLVHNPGVKKGMVKLDESFAGMGNAIVDLSEAAEMLHGSSNSTYHVDSSLKNAIGRALESMSFESKDECWTRFQSGIQSIGAIFEAFVPQQAGQTTPSAQGYISEDGQVTILSTHEQVMDGRHYDGCQFPANSAYGAGLVRYASEVGQVLAKHGVAGHFGVDFMATPPSANSRSNEHSLHALEINLRATGTTFPLMSLLLLNHTSLDTTSPAQLKTKHYITTDHFGSEALKTLTPGDVPDILSRSPYDWSHETQTGVVLYMIGGVAEFGRFGAMFAGDTLEQCKVMMKGLMQIFEDEAEKWNQEAEDVPEDSFSVLVGSVVEASGA